MKFREQKKSQGALSGK